MDMPKKNESGLEIRARALLDDLRDHPEWTDARRAEQLDRLVGGIPREVLVTAVLSRLGNLNGGDGEAILRILEAMGDHEHLIALADALETQTSLSSDRTWDALGVLEGTGLVESRPELLERREDLEELLSDDQSMAELAAEIDNEPASTWLALQGLCEIEPEIRAEIIEGLAEREAGPGVVELLRLLTFAHDPGTRNAAMAGLSGPLGEGPEGRNAWAAIAADHPDVAVREMAGKRLGNQMDSLVAAWFAEGSKRARPSLMESAVSHVDRDGRGIIVLAAEDRGDRVVAAFHCDVMTGITDVMGETHEGSGAFFEQILASPGREWVRNRHGLALGLLAGSALLCGPKTTPALAYWLERTAGPDFRPAQIPPADRAQVPRQPLERVEQAKMILSAVPDWRDTSAITYEIAESLGLRDGDVPIHPRNDPGAFRILFETALSRRLDLYRRMLLWMSYVWAESNQEMLARAARIVAEELADPQNAVPGYPFLEALAVRSLLAAQNDLRRK